MPKLAIWHVEDDSVIDLCPDGVPRQEHKLRIFIDEFLDKPRAGHPVHFNFLASNPFHKVNFLSW